MGEIKELIIGKLTKTHGLKGEIRMNYYGNDDPDSLLSLSKVRVVATDNTTIDLKLERARKSKVFLILKFNGIDSISDVESLVGGVVYANKTELKNPEEDEYYWDDLIGMRVYDEEKVLIGELTSIFETKSNDVYVVKSGSKEILIPAIKDVIKEVDVDNKKMRVHLLKGMRDDF